MDSQRTGEVGNCRPLELPTLSYYLILVSCLGGNCLLTLTFLTVAAWLLFLSSLEIRIFIVSYRLFSSTWSLRQAAILLTAGWPKAPPPSPLLLLWIETLHQHDTFFRICELIAYSNQGKFTFPILTRLRVFRRIRCWGICRRHQLLQASGSWSSFFVSISLYAARGKWKCAITICQSLYLGPMHAHWCNLLYSVMSTFLQTLKFRINVYKLYIQAVSDMRHNKCQNQN